MENKTAGHTPGPWHLGMQPGPIVYGPNGEQVADMRRGMLHRDEDVANIRLIAAAPDMAGEIRKQIGWLKHAREECSGLIRGSLLTGFDQSIKYLTAVLAKAEGR